jgi:hypothetical protein
MYISIYVFDYYFQILSHYFLILLLLLNLYFLSILLATLVMIFNLLVKLLINYHICASWELLYFKSFVDIYNNYQSKILNHDKPILLVNRKKWLPKIIKLKMPLGHGFQGGTYRLKCL